MNSEFKKNMTTRLLTICKYYNQEESCPFAPGKDNKHMLWHAERAFILTMLGNDRVQLTSMVTEYYFYVGDKLGVKPGFCEVQRNAVIFRMYCKQSQSAIGAVPGFVRLMKKHYL